MSLMSMAMVSGRLAVILNKRAGGSFLRMSAARMLLSNPMEGFTAFLKWLFPAQNNAENIKLGIAKALTVYAYRRRESDSVNQK
ncbi:MAG: hypothetical protein Q8R93_04385 [Methylicorpusculum sp.]|uniref:hypothetical protein n=3 Tax=Methylicorpusculum sp. TaxID=2713644 RepID=UPI00272FD223|nr:hypothetical protein [Methylicorpusculum sp.]MDP3528530.1 hypothetical protein [Methylicorpusculum sp.]